MDDFCLSVIALLLMEKSITCQLNMCKMSPSSASTTNHRWLVGWLFMQRRVTSYSYLDGRYLIFSIKGGEITDKHRSFMVNLPFPVRLVQIGFNLIQNLPYYSFRPALYNCLNHTCRFIRHLFSLLKPLPLSSPPPFSSPPLPL